MSNPTEISGGGRLWEQAGHGGSGQAGRGEVRKPLSGPGLAAGQPAVRGAV